MLYITFLVVFLFSLGLATIVIPIIIRISAKKNLFDTPDSRKVHTIPTSRLGGFIFVPVIIAAFNLGLALCSHFVLQVDMKPIEQFACLCAGLIFLYFLGLCDDLIGVQYKWKFFVQIIAACFFLISGLWINSLGGLFGIYDIPAWIGIPLTLFVVVYITNAINLIDGIDGLASGLSCITLLVIGLLSLFYHYYLSVFIIAATLGVLLPFLYYNILGSAKHHGKLFMGDAGSLTIGYILSFFMLRLSHSTLTYDPSEHNHQWLVFSSLIIPLFDVARVVCARYRDGRPLFMPDKNHIHHKFLRTGLSKTGTLISLLLIALSFIAINYVSIHSMQITFLLLLNTILWLGMHFILNYFIKKRETKTGKIWNRAYKPAVKSQL